MFTQDCSEEEDCLERMLVLEPDSPVASADRRHDYKFVSAAQSVAWAVIIALIYVASRINFQSQQRMEFTHSVLIFTVNGTLSLVYDLQIARLGFTRHSHFRIRKSSFIVTIINVQMLALTYCQHHTSISCLPGDNLLGRSTAFNLSSIHQGVNILIKSCQFQHQNTLQSLVDPTRNDVQLSSTDYSRFKKHSPKYTSDVSPAGVIIVYRNLFF